MRVVSDSRGFALPMAILVLALLTISTTAALVIGSAEEREIANGRDQVDAFTLAQSGLEQFLIYRTSLGFTSTPPAAFEYVRINVPGGYADVTLELVRPSVSGSPVVYVIRSLGVRTDPSLPGTPRAEHTVALYARWQSGTISVKAAFTSLTGLRKGGDDGTITGEDQCAGQPDVAGVGVPTPPGYTQSGGSSVPEGSPPIGDMGGYQEAADSTFIDWEGIIDGTALTPDVTLPDDAYPSSVAFANPAFWPVIQVNGNFTMPYDGQGILIVTGNLRINGDKNWRGIILVGGVVTGNGDNGIFGAVLTGLNVKLGDAAAIAAAIGENTIGNGEKRVLYNSCNIAAALSAFGGLSTYPNTWSDNWATY